MAQRVFHYFDGLQEYGQSSMEERRQESVVVVVNGEALPLSALIRQILF